MKFILPDGKVVVGRGYRDIVASMAEEKFTPVTNLGAYRQALALRVSKMYGADISSKTDKDLVLSLLDVGLLVKGK